MKLALCCLLPLLWVTGTGQTASRYTEKKTTANKAKDFLCEVRPREIAPGETAVLRWLVKGATRVVVQEAPDSRAGELRSIGEFKGESGQLEVRPKESTTYVILCEGSTTYTCASTSVRVRVKPR